jgi:formylglycine-generating enzyme required for sulfatase activity
MKVVHQIIEYLDGEGLLTDEFYDRLVVAGWVRPEYLNGRVLTRAEMRALAARGVDASAELPDVGEDDAFPEAPVAPIGRGGHGGRRGSVRERRQDNREHDHDRRRVFREINAALLIADLPASSELAGLRALASRLDATTPWMRPLLEAPEEALDEALLAAIRTNNPSASALLGALSSAVCRFPLTDPRWSRYPGALRAYASVVSGADAASLQRTSRAYAWILREKGVVTAHEVARSQQRVLESLGRVTSRAPETVERWLAASAPRPKKDPRSGTVEVVDLDKGVTLELVWIPKGAFLMGSPEEEQDRYGDEGPQHEVTLRRGFWLGKYPVTQAQWEAVMGNNPSRFKGDGRLPVECVSWEDCQEFITKLNGKVEGAFRLPSEAEWEYACRAGTQTRFYWGDDPNETMIKDYAWYDGNSGGRTDRVGEILPNAWGLHDMSGNVWEWCEDDWHGNYEGAPDDGRARVDIPRGSRRVNRGGGWRSIPGGCRSAFRYRDTPEFRDFSLGFRLALPAVQGGS